MPIWLLELAWLTASWLAAGPLSMGLTTPVPPWVTERMEEKSCSRDDVRTPILPPIREGSPPSCDDPPDEACVLRALPPIRPGIPFVYEESRENVQIGTELLVDKVDAPRFFPLVGPAQLHHCHWKCTVTYDEVLVSSYPFPLRSVRPQVQVVYIDKDCLHLCAPDAGSPSTRDHPGCGDRK